jgi:rare lipoprotein A
MLAGLLAGACTPPAAGPPPGSSAQALATSAWGKAHPPLPRFGNAYADQAVYRERGTASWYGRRFAGRPTASGKLFDPGEMTAAHPELPFGTEVVVTNLENMRTVEVEITDRGPFVGDRAIDLSRAAAEALDMIRTGLTEVEIAVVQ